jgi:hypothetical protein
VVEVAGTYRARRGEIAPERIRTIPDGAGQPGAMIPTSVFGALLEMQAGLAQTNVKVGDLAEAVSKLTATWKDKAVTQIGAVALAALGIVGAQYALRATPPPTTTVVEKAELQIRAEGCAKMANGSDSEYERCMIRDVVAPNTPSVKAFVERR